VNPSQPTILLVDDEPSLISLLTLVFESEGLAVQSALNGPKALSLFSRTPVDLVLLDFLMPGMDGGQVAEQMRILRPRVPIVMLSACLTVPEHVREKVDDFVEKGAGTEALLRVVKKLLQRPQGEGSQSES
jgi:DNA-binding response OmpR family regulator